MEKISIVGTMNRKRPGPFSLLLLLLTCVLIMFQITFAYVYIYAWSVTVIKASILLFYRRIFGMTWLAWCCVFITTGYLITNHIVLPLYCKPLSYYWSQFYKGSTGYCPVDEAKFYLGVGIINMFGDLCILAVPAPAVWRLQMPRAQKIAISFIFLLGGL